MAISAIEEVREQLFLDTADGLRLNNVSGNLGVFRPIFGITNDDEWRALVKKIAYNPKLIQKVFRNIIECCIGPQFNRSANFSRIPEIGDTKIYVNDVSDLIQLGTIIIDAGLPTEETVDFKFANLKDNSILLKNPLKFSHFPLLDTSNVLVADTPAGSTTLVVVNSIKFPVVGYPYVLCVGKGTEQEELVYVTNNNTSTNTLTVSTTVNDHLGFAAAFVRRPLVEDTFAGRTFIKLDVEETRVFPETGWLRLSYGTVDEEIVYFNENDVENNVLYLATPLVNGHAVNDSVELLRSGEIVNTSSITQLGIHWDIFDTDNRNLKIFIPESVTPLRIIDASWLHGSAQPAFSTALASGTLTTDTVIELTSVSGLPDESGLILINSTDIYFYSFRDEDATPNPTLTLTRPIGQVYSPGTTVDYYAVAYLGTDLEDGNVRDLSGNLIDNVFPGKYLYEPLERAPSLTSSSLTSILPPAARVEHSQSAGYTNLEVDDASLWLPPPFTPYEVLVGRTSGFEETATLSDRTLAIDASDSLNANASIGDTSTVLTNSSAFPETDVPNKAGYRVIIDRGGGNEEIVRILDNDTGTNTLTCDPLTVNHLATETVDLLNDTLTFDLLNKNHTGPSVSPTKQGQLVEKLIETLDLASSSGFPNTGTVIINYGYEIIPVRSKITSVISSTVYEFSDTSPFLTTDYPYQIVLGEGLPTEEVVDVTNNDTLLNQLTVTTPVNTHFAGEYVEFRIELPEVVDYQDIDGNFLQFIPPIPLGKHIIGERVTLSQAESVPTLDGFGYPFYLPPDRFLCLTYAFDLVRGAGVSVEIVTER